MAGVAGRRAAPAAEPPIVTERSVAEASTRSRQSSRGLLNAEELSAQSRTASVPAEQRVQQRHSDKVDWGSQHNLVKEPMHLGHLAAPHPDSAIRGLGKNMPPKCMKDLWKMRDRKAYPVGTSSGEAQFRATDSHLSTLSLAAADVRFGHLGNSWSPLGRSQTLGAADFGRSRTMRSPAMSHQSSGLKDHLTTTSSSIGWRPGGQGAEWSNPGTFHDGQSWKHGITQSPVTNYFHNQQATGMENAMRLIL